MRDLAEGNDWIQCPGCWGNGVVKLFDPPGMKAKCPRCDGKRYLMKYSGLTPDDSQIERIQRERFNEERRETRNFL